MMDTSSKGAGTSSKGSGTLITRAKSPSASGLAYRSRQENVQFTNTTSSRLNPLRTGARSENPSDTGHINGATRNLAACPTSFVVECVTSPQHDSRRRSQYQMSTNARAGERRSPLRSCSSRCATWGELKRPNLVAGHTKREMVTRTIIWGADCFSHLGEPAVPCVYNRVGCFRPRVTVAMNQMLPASQRIALFSWRFLVSGLQGTTQEEPTRSKPGSVSDSEHGMPRGLGASSTLPMPGRLLS